MKRKNNLKTVVISILITTIIVGSGVYIWQNKKIAPSTESTAETVSVEGFTYSTGNLPITVSVSSEPIDYTPAQLAAAALECEKPEQTEQVFATMLEAFKGTNKTVYNFKYSEPSQASDTFVVTLIPNKLKYSEEMFENMFEVCAAGAKEYPKMANKNWLLFTSTCGGASDDSGNPIGCQEIKDVLEPTLELN